MAMYPCLFGGGSGPAPVLITKNITANGTYNAADDNADGFSSVSVAVPGGGGSGVTETILNHGQISDGTNRQFITQSFGDISAFDIVYIVIDYDGTNNRVFGIKVSDIGNGLNFTADLPESNTSIDLAMTKTSITATWYSGSWCDVYATVYTMDAATLGEKTISTYGVFNASDDSLDGYSKVTNITGLETATVSGAVASISDAVAMPCPSVVAQIVPVQAGSGTPSPSNVRTLSGSSSVNLYQSGLNIWDEQWENGGINETNGQNQANPSKIRPVGYIQVRPNTTYYKLCPELCQIIFYGYDKNFIGIEQNSYSNSRTFTTPSNVYYIRFNVANAYGGTYNSDISINYPSTDTAYHAHTGTTYTAALGQTVYGGTIDFVSGTLTVTHAIVDLGELNYTYQNDYTRFYSGGISSEVLRPASNADIADCYCECYQVVASNSTVESGAIDLSIGVSTTGNVVIRDTNYTSGYQLKTSLSGKYLVYPLATPLTFSITPQTITTAQVNNFYCDTGDTSVSYYREKLPELERLFYFEGVQSDTVQIPPAISLDEGDSFSEYLSYDTTTKKFTVLKAFSALVTGWVEHFQSASSYGSGQFVVNDTAKMTYQVPSTSAGSKGGYTSVFDFAVGDTFWAYQNTNNGWPQQFLKVYLLDNVSVSGVIELDDETA